MTNKKKRLLVAGGGYADIPLIQSAKSLGFHVITSGNRPNDLGHKYSDEVHLEDFSDKESMLRLSESLQIDAICASCNDFSALTAAYVAEQMGLPGHDDYETSLILHHKDKYRAFAQKYNIDTPKAKGFTDSAHALDELQNFTFPILIKPVDLTGGKGITKLHDDSIARQALVHAFETSREHRLVIEEFVSGTRHGLSLFLIDEKVTFSFSDNEYYYLNPFLVSAASTPANVDQDVITKLHRSAERIANLLHLKTGIFHIQYILHHNKPIIIEICRRAPGDLYIKFVQHATKIDYPSYIVKAAAGMDCSDIVNTQPDGYYTRHCIMAPRNGVINEVCFSPDIESLIIDQLTLWKRGDIIDNFLTHKLGILFLKFKSMEEMLNISAELNSLIQLDIE